MKKNLIIPLLLILIMFFLAACGTSQVEETAVVSETEFVAQPSGVQGISTLSFLDQLTEFKSEFDLSSLSEISWTTEYCDAAGLCTFEAAEEGVIAENLYSLSNGQGLFFNLTFSEPFQQDQSPLQFIFLDSSANLVLEQNGVTVLVDNLPYAQYPFSASLTWEIGKDYSLFFLMDKDGGFSASIWEKGKPESLTYTSTLVADAAAGFPETPSELNYEMSLWISQNQKIKISNIWALGSDNSSMQISASEMSEEQAVVDPTPEGPVFVNLEEYAVLSAEPVEQITCDSINASSTGTFRWEGRNDANCDLYLKNGEALFFEFVLDNDMEPDQSQVIWMLNAQNGEDNEYGIGIAGAEASIKVLENHSQLVGYEFDREIVWEKTKRYSLMMALDPDGGKLFRIWETENPQNRITSHILAEEWQIIIPNSDELIWNFGVWMMQRQSVTIENMQVLQIEPSSENTAAAEEIQSELDEVSLSNLTGYQVNAVLEIPNLVCESEFEKHEETWQFSGGAEGLAGNCDLEIQSGQAIMLDFMIKEAFSSETGRIALDLSSSTGSAQEESNLIQIEFSPTSNDFGVKQNHQFISGDQIQGNISWKTTENYRLVFIIEGDGSIQVLIWPANSDETPASFRVESQELQNILDGSDLQSFLWKFGYYIAEGQGLDVMNIRKLEITGNYLLPESLSAQGISEQDMSDQIVNLRDYYIVPSEAMSVISCEDGQMVDSAIYRIVSVDELLRGECNLTFKTGQALAFNFSYDSELNEDGNRIFLEFNDPESGFGGRTSFDLLHQMVQIKKDETGAGEFSFSKALSLLPGETYTVFVFAGEYGYKHILVFPADRSVKEVLEDPQNVAYTAISQLDWYRMFAGADLEQNLRLVYEISGNLSLNLSNAQIYELQ